MGQQNNKQICCNNASKVGPKSVEDLIYYMTVQDKQLGKVAVYSSSKKPSCYIAKIQYKIQNSSVFNLYQKIQNNQLSCLASLHAFQIKRQKYFTGHIQQTITSYWQYYNYFFSDYMKMRSFKGNPFTQKQLWYIIKNCCESFSLFDSYNYVLDLDINNILIIPEGKLKFYWNQIRWNNQHLKFYKKVRERFSHRISLKKQEENRKFTYNQQNESESFYYSPQEIEAIQKRQQTVQIDFSKSNSFRLGMILLYCITFTNPIKTCYSRPNQKGVNRIKLMVLNSLYENKIENSQKYSQDLKHLIKLLLLQDHNKRIPITCLQNIYQKHMSQDGQLMMGIADNPFHIQTSSRKNLNEPSRQERIVERKKTEIFSEKFINEQMNQKKINRNESNIREQYVIRNNNEKSQMSIHLQQDEEIVRRQYDKFDTKTVKISTSYHKKQK